MEERTQTTDTIEQFISEVSGERSALRKLLDPKNNILLITHTDMDGIGCEMVLRKFCPNLFPIYMSPNEIDLVMESLDTRMFQCILISDLCCSNDYILSDPRVITVDHHSTAKKFANEAAHIFVNEAVAATRLMYHFCETVFEQDIGFMDDFTNIVDDYDTWKMKDNRSYAFNYLFDVYGKDGFKERFGKTFDTELTLDEMKKWDAELDRIEKNVEEMPVFVRNYGVCKIGVIVNGEYKNEYCEKILKDKSLGLDLLIYIWYPFGGSVRMNNEITAINIGELIQSNKLGGGHQYAGGFRSKDKTVAGTLEALRVLMDAFVEEAREKDIHGVHNQSFISESLNEDGEMPF